MVRRLVRHLVPGPRINDGMKPGGGNEEERARRIEQRRQYDAARRAARPAIDLTQLDDVKARPVTDNVIRMAESSSVTSMFQTDFTYFRKTSAYAIFERGEER
ncbi:hypothetical protein HPB50_023624 [Hyalomma asiaticum]|uniref:Uncharacterized protein n=1 Tax=Hyalomma asiaticum TaxID=266040 RepID=A0ACB7T404_HYAAI|nr:hypothetical protein HPB50_023624 [Hyalomma asiaticum]